MPRALGYESHQGLTTDVPQDWGKQQLRSWGAYTMSRVHQDPGQKQCLCKTSLVAKTVKRLPTTQETGFSPWVRKILWRRKWQPTPVFLPGESHGQRSLVSYSPWGRKESDMTERLHFPFTCESLGQTYLLVLEGLLGEEGAVVAHCGDTDTGEDYSPV